MIDRLIDQLIDRCNVYVSLKGQARLDGAFCEYEEEDKMKFLQELRNKGVCNIEMESLGFLAMCHYAGVKGRTKNLYTLYVKEVLKSRYCDMNMDMVRRDIHQM